MQIEDTDNPSEVEDTVDETTLDTEQEPENEPELDEDGNPIADEVEDEDEDEIDLDEETKLKLPKSQAEKLRLAMLRQSDYTRKTQEVAEIRKALEAERDQSRQMDQVEQTARGEYTLNQMQLNQYEQYDWNAAYAQARVIDEQNFDSSQKDQLDAQWRQYKQLESRQQKVGQLLAFKDRERQSRRQQSQQAQSAAIAKLMDEGTPELKKAIPDWSRAKAATLTDAMVKHFGIPRDEFDGIDDPRLYMVMAAAVQWQDHQSKQKKAQTLQKQQEVTPAAKATGNRNPIPPGRVDDRLSADEWMKRRNEQTRKRA